MSQTETDAIVIGSGFGGSVTAGRLAEAGVRVTVLERGHWWDTVPTRSMGIEHRTPFPRGLRLFTHSVRAIYHPFLPWGRTVFNRRGLFEIYYSKGMEVICSSGVGGGSHVYSAVHRRPAALDYWDGRVADLGESTMDVHYRNFMTRMGSTKPGPHNRPPHTAAEVYAEAPNFEASVPKVDVRVGFLLPEDPANPRMVRTEAGVERWEADYTTGDHGFLGAPSGAKATVDFIYLAPALGNGLTVEDQCEVLFIERIAEHGKRFAVHFYDYRSGRRRTMKAEHVFVGAGTMNTLRILLESRDIYAGLKGMPDLGHRFSGNGDIRGFWDLNDRTRDYTQGLPSKGAVLLRGSWEPKIGIGRNNMPSIGYYPLPDFIRNRLKHGLVVSGMGADAMDGIASIKNGHFNIFFDPSNSPIYNQIYDTMQEMGRRSGRKIYANRRPSTVHPMGGACVGRADQGGVIGADGQVHDIPGLFVVDAAAFPAPIAAPPTMSIGAWAENVASCFVTR